MFNIKAKDRIGEIGFDKNKVKMKIIEYYDCHNVIIEFQDEYKAKVHTTYKAFKNSQVKNPYSKTICNLGYLGVGKYSHKEYEEIYEVWRNMIRRCYDPYRLNKKPTYINCYVCEEWHNFQTFAEWYEENYYEVPNERVELDKDILIKGNKIYSPETCILVPRKINILFVKRDSKRGEYPIGVSYLKECDKFRAYCDIQGKQKYLGIFDTFEQAFSVYKNFKESYIKQIADEYKSLIPQMLYEVMYEYKVEIDD